MTAASREDRVTAMDAHIYKNLAFFLSRQVKLSEMECLQILSLTWCGTEFRQSFRSQKRE